MDLTIAEIQALSEKVIANLEQVVVGKRRGLELTLVGLLCQGHLLIEDVPGVGKTILARSLAQSIGCTFSRIQFTPDLLPSDITGTSIFNQQTREFEFRPGPIIGHIVLADEINRATPKTQSALLEAMEERQITIDGVVHALPEPFMVIGTQNPIEYEGTFPLPEAQLDRFLLRLGLGYLTKAEEIRVMQAQQFRHPIHTLAPLVSQAELLDMQESVKKVFVAPAVEQYIVDITFATRENENVYLGASPRGSLGLYRAGQAQAALLGRDYVLPDDIKTLAEPILAHRVIVSPTARMKKLTAQHIVENILQQLPIPTREPRRNSAWQR
ncbi:MAG TPA: MoxR family ATPase [Anaerolineae bacterium]|nr:MoxR family ATPase [Anaerolineae bacterium]